jgi:hypothetical protein
MLCVTAVSDGVLSAVIPAHQDQLVIVIVTLFLLLGTHCQMFT